MKGLTNKGEIKTICANLADLIDAGTFTPLPNEIRKIRLQLDKKPIVFSTFKKVLSIPA
jgi:hypothetical protein